MDIINEMKKLREKIEKEKEAKMVYGSFGSYAVRIGLHFSLNLIDDWFEENTAICTRCGDTILKTDVVDNNNTLCQACFFELPF
jgi:formylmethanofuran dehydrogenase subunit E